MKTLLKELNEKSVHLYPAKDSIEIYDAEKKLGILFSNEYKEFLENIGAVSFNGEEIFGLGVNERSYRNVINATKELRETETKFPENMLVLYSFGDGHQYYLYDNQSQKVIHWNCLKEDQYSVFNGNLWEFIKKILFG